MVVRIRRAIKTDSIGPVGFSGSHAAPGPHLRVRVRLGGGSTPQIYPSKPTARPPSREVRTLSGGALPADDTTPSTRVNPKIRGNANLAGAAGTRQGNRAATISSAGRHIRDKACKLKIKHFLPYHVPGTSAGLEKRVYGFSTFVRQERERETESQYHTP